MASPQVSKTCCGGSTPSVPVKKYIKGGNGILDKYFTKMAYLSTIEDELMKVHRISRSALDEESYYSEFGTSKEFYKEDGEYRNLVDDFKKLQRKIEPEVVGLLTRVLALRKKYIEKNN